jgi:hypothetical protein
MDPQEDRQRGIRRVQRLSNWTAAALVAATAVTAGFFSRTAAVSPARHTTTVTAGTQLAGPGSRQPCVTVPVATSGGSGVTVPAQVRTCAPGTTGSRPVVIYVKSAGEGGD